MQATGRYSLIGGDGDVQLGDFAAEVEAGLTARAKRIPCRFLYDERGSLFFEEICGVEDYYLTRAEREILERRSREIAARFSRTITLAELGSGSAAKTRLLIEAFLRQHGALRYVPVDISRSILESSALDLLERYQALEVRAIAGEYREGLRHVEAQTDRPKLIAWLGSNVGNLEREDAAGFLSEMCGAMKDGDRLLIGIDLRKERAVLESAYDDAEGVTARFSLNLLERMNRELGASFETDAFRHRAVYRDDEGRVEIHLVSQREQRVAIAALDLEVQLAEGEGIHVENAYKYSPEEIDTLAANAGMRVDCRWLDTRGRLSLNLFAPLG